MRCICGGAAVYYKEELIISENFVRKLDPSIRLRGAKTTPVFVVVLILNNREGSFLDEC